MESVREERLCMCVFASGFSFFFFTAKTKFTQLLDGGQHIELTQPHTHTRWYHFQGYYT